MFVKVQNYSPLMSLEMSSCRDVCSSTARLQHAPPHPFLQVYSVTDTCGVAIVVCSGEYNNTSYVGECFCLRVRLYTLDGGGAVAGF